MNQGQQFAFISYFTFNCDTKTNIPVSTKNVKQLVIVNSMPFAIKSIYGLESQKDSNGIQEVKGQQEQDKECTICMSKESDTIIMPCGHLCVCNECGEQIRVSKHNMCPVCRGGIKTLVPLKR